MMNPSGMGWPSSPGPVKLTRSSSFSIQYRLQGEGAGRQRPSSGRLRPRGATYEVPSKLQASPSHLGALGK